MSTYLLLRDNKQSGPYSTEELIAKGIKAYDLVWLEGKSAAWRYPSELPELKPYAPAVEEQPYDRFYKKSPAENTVAEATATVAATAPATVKEMPRSNNRNNIATPKGIYVTLPASGNNTVRRQVVAAAAAPIPQTVNASPVTVQKEAVPAAVATPEYQPAASSSSWYNEPVASQVPQYSSNNNTTTIRMIVATCLLLGGIVIGLGISSAMHTPGNASLDKLVQAIQERNSRGNQVAAIKNTTPVSTNINEPAGAPAQGVAAQTIAPKTAVVQKKVTLPPAVADKQPDDVPVKDVKEEQPVTVHQPEETASKNEPDETVTAAMREILQQQVSVAPAGSYKTGVLGGISGLQLTVSNKSRYALDEVAVEVKYLGPEKRVVKTQTVLFSDIAPGEQKTLEAPRSKRGVSVDYIITSIQSKALGLAKSGF